MLYTLDDAALNDEMSRDELARRRHELWRTLRVRGVPLCDCPPIPLPTTTIAALFGVSDRAVRKGIAKAECIRGALHEHARRAESA